MQNAKLKAIDNNVTSLRTTVTNAPIVDSLGKKDIIVKEKDVEINKRNAIIKEKEE